MAIERLEDQHLPGNTNVTLAFSSTSGSYSLRTRVRGFAHKWEVVADESHARAMRAMYPKQRAVGKFALTFELNGYTEFAGLMTFFKSYVDAVGTQFDTNNSPRPTMSVVLAVRNFARNGVPISGMSMGDHMGSMVFRPTVVFESAHDPFDNTILLPGQASTFDPAGTEDDVRNFFYPWSAASYDTTVKPETQYDLGGTGSGDKLGVGTAVGTVNGAVESILDGLGRTM